MIFKGTDAKMVGATAGSVGLALRCLTGVITVAVTLASGSTEVARAASVLSDQKAMAGFECALLLAFTATLPDVVRPVGSQDEIDRLHAYADEAAKASIGEIRRSPSFQKEGIGGLLSPFITTRSDDFWIGLLFASTSRQIQKFLDDNVPAKDGVDFEGMQQRRAEAALAEYLRRNCGLVGRD